MKSSKKHTGNEENFWLSATDMMAGILTVVLLLLMLFVLYLNQSKDEVFTPLDATQNMGDETRRPETPAPTGNGEYTTETYSNGGGEGASETPTQEIPTTPPIQSAGEEGTDKAAVFVTVVDADTGNTIKKSGIEFELYVDKNGIGGLQTLHTYYPTKIEYKDYETTEQGTFYLPEKITDGWYSLHNTVAPQGYYREDFTDFEIDDFYDWPEPYMVKVELSPIKSTVRVYVEDPDDKQPVEGVEYEVVAAEDIQSGDGTVRYTAGKVVDRLATDEEGRAESIELYLGEYFLRQISAPEYYAVSAAPIPANVGEPSDSETEGVIEIECSKTAVTVTVTDELTESPVKGVVFALDDREEKYETDDQGRFVVSELKKNASYTLRLEELPDGYRTDSTELTFIVDGNGLVNDEPAASIDTTVYTLTLSAAAKDKVFGRAISAVDMELLDQSGTVVDTWTSNKEPHIVTGLDEGTYYLQKLGDEDTRIEVTVEDTAKKQNAALYLWDVLDLFVLLIAAGAVILAVLIVGLTISRRKKVKKDHE